MTTINPTGSGPFLCRPCNRRFEVGGRCSHCGTLRTAWYEPKRPAAKCPGCGFGSSRDLGDGARECLHCHATFETVEVGYLDTRGLVNAIKREELEQRARAKPRQR